MYSAKYGNLDCLNHLIANGASVSAPDKVCRGPACDVCWELRGKGCARRCHTLPYCGERGAPRWCRCTFLRPRRCCHPRCRLAALSRLAHI